MSEEVFKEEEFDPEDYCESQRELMTQFALPVELQKMGAYLQLENQKLEFALYQYKRMQKFCFEELTNQDIFNYEGKAYINADGIDKFRGPFGLYEKDKVVEITYTDGSVKTTADPDHMKGEFKYIVVKGTIGSTRLGTEAYFTGGTTITFMNNKKIDGNNLHWLKTADTNWFTRAAKKLLGLNSIAWESMPKVKEAECRTVVMKKENDPEFKAKADEVWRMCLELSYGDIEAAKQVCITFSSYVRKDMARPNQDSLTRIILVRVNWMS
jgi:hypothetical protein